MVGHHNGIVDYQVQGNGNPCQGIELHLQSQSIVEDKRNGQIDRQTGDNQEQIAQVPCDQSHEYQQNQDSQSRTEINLVQFLLDMFRCIITDMHFISRRHLLFQFPHGLLHLLAQFQLICGFFCRQVQINGVQSIDTVVTGRLCFYMHDLDELFQAHQGTLFRLQADVLRMKFGFLSGRSLDQSNPFPSSVSFLNGADTQEFLFIMTGNGRLDVRHGNSQIGQLDIVVFQLPFHWSRPCQFHLIDTLQLSQYRFDVLFCIPLDKDWGSRSIQGIGHERAVGISVRTACTDLWITHSLRQLRPSLAHNGRNLETGRIHIGMLIHFQGNASTTVIRCGIDILHSFNTSQHSLQATGHFRLDDTRRVARHRERDRQSRQGARRRQLDRQERKQCQADQ